MPKVPSVWTVLSMLKWATEYFEERSVNSPRFSIEWLLAHVLSIKRLDLYLEYDRPLSSSELSELKPLVKRRAEHEPLQYITGETDFHNTTIKVKPGVLIPRQETEELVSWILESHKDTADLKVLDIGTGSGCIAIALKKAKPDWSVFATDISEDALLIARENAALNEVSVDFHKEDLFHPTVFPAMEFDLIISNPPYILPSEKNTLDEEVKNYEPELALFCESTQKMYGAVTDYAQKKLKPNGHLYLELHEHYSGDVLQLFDTPKWEPFIKNDYSDKPRFLRAKPA